MLLVLVHYIVAFYPYQDPFADPQEESSNGLSNRAVNPFDKGVVGMLSWLRQFRLFESRQKWAGFIQHVSTKSRPAYQQCVTY